MEILFVHDHPFLFNRNGFYTTGSLTAAVWSRYLEIFENLTVVGRNAGEICENDKNLYLSSREKVEFKLLPNISNFKSLLFGNTIAETSCKELVASHDAVIARLPSRLGSLFVKEAIKQKKPYAIEIVGCPWDALWNYGNWKGKLLAPFAAFSLKRLASTAPFTLYVSELFLQKRYPSSSAVSTHVSNVEIPRTPNEAILKQRIQKNKESRLLINFGLIGHYSSKYKGIDTAIKSLALVNHSFSNWRLQILGAGDPCNYQRLAKKLGVSEKIDFIGTLPSGEPVFNWLDTIDIYLQPSLTEGLPRALIEAMSRGCPVLATSVGGIPELLDTEHLFSPGDYKELSNLIESIICSPNKLNTMSFNNHSKAKLYYKPVLDKRRQEFWSEFRKHIEACKVM